MELLVVSRVISCARCNVIVCADHRVGIWQLYILSALFSIIKMDKVIVATC